MSSPDATPADVDQQPHAAYAIDAAVELLASLRGLRPRGPAVTVHLLAALQRQLERDLLGAILDARDHGYSTDQIADLLHP